MYLNLQKVFKIEKTYGVICELNLWEHFNFGIDKSVDLEKSQKLDRNKRCSLKKGFLKNFGVTF